jgi:16S rRNA (adenine1518-N6/adenine1519-N6)-dimethyltransferase
VSADSANWEPLRAVIARHGLSASKALGQNFILDRQLLAKIAAIPGDLTGQTVYEVGPGPGVEQRVGQAAGAKVVAVERDRRCLPALAELEALFPGKLRVIEGDALEIDERVEIARVPSGSDGTPTKAPHIVANLPYNVGTALLIRWLAGPWPPWWSSLTLMFQKEVAERIVAPVGGDHYGRLAIASQWRATPKIALLVHRSSFTPPPKVASAVVHIVPAPAPDGVQHALLERLTAAAFGQRRKMLRQSLKGVPGALDALAGLGIDSQRRAEMLSVDEFVALAKALG